MSDSSTDAQAIDLTSLDEALGGGGDSSVAAANKSANEGSNAPSTSASLPASDEAHNTTAPLASGPDEKATRTEEAVPQSPATLSPASLSPQSLSPNPVAPAPLPDVQADAAPQGETAEEAGARHAAAGAGLAAQDTAPATNPDVEAFRGMFPDLAPDVIAAVLHAHNGNSESGEPLRPRRPSAYICWRSVALRPADAMLVMGNCIRKALPTLYASPGMLCIQSASV